MTTTTKKWVPVAIDDVRAAFSTKIDDLMPPYSAIPDEFKDDRNKWCKVVSAWFFCGLKDAKWTQKPGIDKAAALRHVKAVMSSWEPKHEHKEAGCAFLLNEWFSDVTYTKGATK